MRRTAFTLVEVVVVAVIIALIAAIAFPIIARSKKAAIQTKSIANMRQVYIAIQMYRGDGEQVAFGEMYAMGLPPAPSVKFLSTSIAELYPPTRGLGRHYLYYPIPGHLDTRVPPWEKYTQTHFGATVLLADPWLNTPSATPPYTDPIMDPRARKHLLGITLDGALRRKQASGHLDLAWWDRN